VPRTLRAVPEKIPDPFLVRGLFHEIARPAQRALQGELSQVVVDGGSQVFATGLPQGLDRLKNLDRQALGIPDPLQILVYESSAARIAVLAIAICLLLDWTLACASTTSHAT